MALKKPSDLFGKKETSGVFGTPEVEPHITDSYNKFVDNFETVNEIAEKTKVFEKVDELSERIELLSKELSEKLTRTDLENAMLSQLMVLDENFKTIQSQVKGLNKEDLREFKSTVLNLSQVVDNLVETELPKYKNQLAKSKVFVGEQVQELQEIVEENITGIREEIDEKFDNIAEVIDNNLEYFSNQLQETSSKVKKTTETFNNLSKIVENKVAKENERLDEYSQIIESLEKAFEELSYTLKEELNTSSQLTEEKFEEYKTQFENISTGLEKSVDKRLDSYRKELVEVKTEVAINEQHIKNVDKYLKDHHQGLVELKEEVFSEIEKLPVGNLQENIERLEKKIDYIKETYSKIEPEVIVKEVIKEGLLNEPPETNNDDPLTPLDQNFVTLDQLQQHYRLFLNRIQQQLSTLGGGGETRLEFLDDVDRNSAKQNGYVLQYDASVGKFIGTSYVPGGGGGGESYWVSTAAGIHTLSNVGIGTTNPTAKLFVEGDARITGILSVGQGTVTINGITNTVNVDNLVVGTTLTGPGGVGYATVGYVTQQISNLVDGAPGALDTLNELAAALNDDENFATTVTNSLALKAPINNANLTGVTTTGLLNVGVGGTIITTTGIGSVGIGSTLPGSTLVVNAGTGSTANILDVQRNGISALKVLYYDANSTPYLLMPSGGVFQISGSVQLSANAIYGTRLGWSGSPSWGGIPELNMYSSSATTGFIQWNADLYLYRDSANVLAQRNAGIGQTFRIYNTYTSASQYERAYLGWNNNTFEIGVGTAGISTARSISLVGAAGSNTGDTLQPLQINQTWTAGSGIATALTLNVTDTSSNASSNLLDLRVGGSSKAYINKNGRVFANAVNFAEPAFTVIGFGGLGQNGSSLQLRNSNTGSIFGLDSDGGFAFNDSVKFYISANILEQRNAGVGQTFRIYNTYTSSTNFERANVGWTTDVFIVGTEKGSAGGTARQLELQTDGTTRVAITTDGYVGIGSTQPGSTLVVNAPSGYSGNLLDFQVAGARQLGISTTGQYIAYDSAFSASHIFRFANQNTLNSNGLSIWNNGGASIVFGYGNTKSANTNWFTLDASTLYTKRYGFNTVAQNAGDLFLERDAANVLAQRNAGVGQTFRIYNTYTSASQYERAYLGWNNNTFQIGVDTAGISTARSISLVGAAGSNTGDTLQPLQINQTWTAGSGIATAITVNVTDTSSSSSSNLLDLRVGGSGRFQIDKNGTTIRTADGGCSLTNIAGTRSHIFGINSHEIRSGGGNGTTLNVPSRGVLELGEGPNLIPQTLRIYNTNTNTVNYERAYLGWTSNTFVVGTQTGGTGTARQLELQTDGTTRVAITTTGLVGIGSTQPTAKLDVVGDVRVGVDTSQGLILTSPNGTKFRLSVDDSGNLTTTSV